MITEIDISGYKSIDNLKLDLGRINVFIGENGAGKSNILEAIALAGAAVADKLDNEFLTSRGIRVAKPEQMRPAFPDSDATGPIRISIKDDQNTAVLLDIQNDNAPYSKWTANYSGESSLSGFEGFKSFITSMEQSIKTTVKERSEQLALMHELFDKLGAALERAKSNINTEESQQKSAFVFNFQLDNELAKFASQSNHLLHSHLSKYLGNFVIFSPENSLLRTYQREGQIEPLGINGEGLLKLLSVCSKEPEQRTLNQIKKRMKILGWFEDLNVRDGNNHPIEIWDRYLNEEQHNLNIVSANEGFLLLLFYFLLFSSDLTPSFFAIDNIDASMNPKLCEALIKQLVEISKTNNKQAIFTTHNPSILDGLNLDDEDQRLFVVSRKSNGATKVKRVKKPKNSTLSDRPHRLSELFLRGALGGLPKGF